jgi:glycosyltransferase involved in cell wall biosynthesis
MLDSDELVRGAKLVVVVCTRDLGSVNFHRTLTFLSAQEWPRESAFCIVINADSEQGDLAGLDQISLPAVPVWLTQERRLGFSSARNAGLRACLQSEALIFLDDDTIVETDWIVKMWHSHKSDSNAVLGSLHDRLMIMPTDQIETDHAALRVREQKSATLSGSNGLLLPLKTLGDLRFNELFNNSGGEDTDMLLRLALLGHEEKTVDCIALELDRVSHDPWWQDAIFAYRSGRLWVVINRLNDQPVGWFKFKAIPGIFTAGASFLFAFLRPQWLRRRKMRLCMRRLGVLLS